MRQIELDIEKNRKCLNYSKRIYIKRILWTFGKFFFRNSPRIAFGFGDWSAIGEDTLIYNLGRVVIGKKATISHRTHICAGTHDYTNPTLPLLRPEIHIGDQAWICANAFIGPNTHIGEGAIIGAGTVLMKDAEAWGIYAGNPAKYIKKRILS